MIIHFSMNLTKATVQIKDIIASNKIISIKKLVTNSKVNRAVDEIITTLIASSAIILSGVEGPNIIRISNRTMDNRINNKEINMNNFMRTLLPESLFQMNF